MHVQYYVINSLLGEVRKTRDVIIFMNGFAFNDTSRSELEGGEQKNEVWCEGQTNTIGFAQNKVVL